MVQSKTDGDCLIDIVHRPLVHLTDILLQPFSVDGPYLFQHDKGSLVEP